MTRIIAGGNNDLLYGDDTGGLESGADFIWGGAGQDNMFGGNGADNICGYHGSDYFTGGAGADYFNLFYDVKMGDVDLIFDLSAGDYVLMQKAFENDCVFFESGGYAYGYVGGPAGTYYLFGAAGMTAAQLDAFTLFI